jgi:hypothetical protein
MIVLMIGIVMAVWVRVAGSVRVLVFMFVEDDLQPPAERVGYATQGGEARNMIAALKSRDHGLGHLKPLRQLLLRLAGVRPKLEQTMRALGGDQRAVVVCRPGRAMAGLFHDRT